MNKVISLFQSNLKMKRSTAASIAQIASRDTAPHPLLVTAGSNLLTEVVMLRRQERNGCPVYVEATLAPHLGYNLVTCAMVKRLRREDEIQDLDLSNSSPMSAHEAVLGPKRCVLLGVAFARNVGRTWNEQFFVVEELSDGMELMLGRTMCEKAKIATRDRICLFRAQKISAGNNPHPFRSLRLHAFPLLTCMSFLAAQEKEDKDAKKAQKEADEQTAKYEEDLRNQMRREARERPIEPKK